MQHYMKVNDWKTALNKRTKQRIVLQSHSTLPSWKISQIILTVVNLLSEEGYFREGFDYMEMIRKKGIVLKEYSAFKSENLLELQKVSIGLWNEGLCLIFPDPQTGATCRMITYNDNKSAAEVMQIIFHELAHIILRHTQQSNIGEMKATLFSGVAMLLMQKAQPVRYFNDFASSVTFALKSLLNDCRFFPCANRPV